MKKLIGIFLVVALLLASTCFGSLAEENTVTYRTGSIGESPEDLIGAKSFPMPANFSRAAFPTVVDNTSKFPTPGNQGDLGSCTAWAVGYALKSNNEYIKRGWTISDEIHHFSPSYIYNQINEGKDEGSDIRDAIDLIINEGVCTMAYMDYDDTDYTTQPTAIQTANAALYKASGFYEFTNLDQIKVALYVGYGVVISVNTYPDLRNLSSSNQIYDTVSGVSEGGHAICLIGYDDSKNAFKFINSWGTSWGLGGYGWISYDLVNSSTVNRYGAGIGLAIDYTDDSYLMGDVNGDGSILSADAQLALSYSVGSTTLTATQIALADVNGDAVINAADSREILRYATGTITQFPLYD